LDSEIEVKISGISPVTRRRINNVYTFGRYAHANPKKRKTLKEWEKSQIKAMFLQFEYICILVGICDIIDYIYELNKEVLSFLKDSK